MKVKVDKKNGVVIAYGSYKSCLIKAIAVCKEDVFDEEFGIQLAKKKYAVQRSKVKRGVHKAALAYAKERYRKLGNFIRMETELVEHFDAMIEESKQIVRDFVDEKFEK